jgi:hypothetical protein
VFIGKPRFLNEQVDGVVDLLVNLAAAFNIVGRKPAAHAFVLQIGVEPIGELLVFGGVADEARIELDGSGDRLDESDHVVGHSAAKLDQCDMVCPGSIGFGERGCEVLPGGRTRWFRFN